MFRFNFNVAETDDMDSMESTSETSAQKKKWHKAQLHTVNNTHLMALSEENTVEEVALGQIELKYLSMTSALERLKKNEPSSDVLPMVTDNTDLVPAIYEGGLKIWECTWDLLSYMQTSELDFNGCRVLELGCGAGLPAIYAMLHGAHATVQDYNEEVINYITIPNVLLNATDLLVLEDGDPVTFKNTIEEVMSKSCFYSGDWEALDNILCTVEPNAAVKSGNNLEGPSISNNIPVDSKFDVILTSETIYNPDCHEKLLSLMTNHLKQDGKILLAAKSYYFGVGGGILQFCDLVTKRNLLNIKTVFTHETGVKREILELTFKSS